MQKCTLKYNKTGFKKLQRLKNGDVRTSQKKQSKNILTLILLAQRLKQD